MHTVPLFVAALFVCLWKKSSKSIMSVANNNNLNHSCVDSTPLLTNNDNKTKHTKDTESIMNRLGGRRVQIILGLFLATILLILGEASSSSNNKTNNTFLVKSNTLNNNKEEEEERKHNTHSHINNNNNNNVNSVNDDDIINEEVEEDFTTSNSNTNNKLSLSKWFTKNIKAPQLGEFSNFYNDLMNTRPETASEKQANEDKVDDEVDYDAVTEGAIIGAW